MDLMAFKQCWETELEIEKSLEQRVNNDMVRIVEFKVCLQGLDGDFKRITNGR